MSKRNGNKRAKALHHKNVMRLRLENGEKELTSDTVQVVLPDLPMPDIAATLVNVQDLEPRVIDDSPSDWPEECWEQEYLRHLDDMSHVCCPITKEKWNEDLDPEHCYDCPIARFWGDEGFEL